MSIEERVARALEERRIELPEDVRRLQAEITQLRAQFATLQATYLRATEHNDRTIVALRNLLNASSIAEDWFSSAKMDSAGRRLLDAQQVARAVLFPTQGNP